MEKNSFYFSVELNFYIKNTLIEGKCEGYASTYQDVSNIIVKKVLMTLYYHYFSQKNAVLDTSWIIPEDKVAIYFQESSSSEIPDVKFITCSEGYFRDMEIFIDSLFMHQQSFILLFKVEKQGQSQVEKIIFTPSQNISKDIIQHLSESLERNYGAEFVQNILTLELYDSSSRQRRLSPEEIFHYQKLGLHEVFINVVPADPGPNRLETEEIDTTLSTYEVKMLLERNSFFLSKPNTSLSVISSSSSTAEEPTALGEEKQFYLRFKSKINHLARKNVPTAYFENINRMHRLFFPPPTVPQHFSTLWAVNDISKLFSNIYVHIVDVRGLPVLSRCIRDSSVPLSTVISDLITKVSFDGLETNINRLHFFLDPFFGSLVLERDLSFLAAIGLDTIHARVEMKEFYFKVNVVKSPEKWITTQHPIAFPFKDKSKLESLVDTQADYCIYVNQEQIPDERLKEHAAMFRTVEITILENCTDRQYQPSTIISTTILSRLAESPPTPFWVPKNQSRSAKVATEFVKKDIDFLLFNGGQDTRMAAQQFANLHIFRENRTPIRFMYVDEHDRRCVTQPYFGDCQTHEDLYKVAKWMTGLTKKNIFRMRYTNSRGFTTDVEKDFLNVSFDPSLSAPLVLVMKVSAALSVTINNISKFIFAKTTNINIPDTFEKFRTFMFEHLMKDEQGESILHTVSMPMTTRCIVEVKRFQQRVQRITDTQDWGGLFYSHILTSLETPFIYRPVKVNVRCPLNTRVPMGVDFTKQLTTYGGATTTVYKIIFPDDFVLEDTLDCNAVREQDVLVYLENRHHTHNLDMARVKIQTEIEDANFRRFGTSVTKDLIRNRYKTLRARVCPRYIKVNLYAMVKTPTYPSAIRCSKELPTLIDKLHCPTFILVSDLFEDFFKETKELNDYDADADVVKKVFVGGHMYDFQIPLHAVIGMKKYDELNEITFVYTNMSTNKAHYVSQAVLGAGFSLPSFVLTKQNMLSDTSCKQLFTPADLYNVDIEQFNSKIQQQEEFLENLINPLEEVERDSVATWYFILANKLRHLLLPTNMSAITDPRARLCFQNYLATLFAASSLHNRNALGYQWGVLNSNEEYPNPDGISLTLKVIFHLENTVLPAVVVKPWEQIFSSAVNFWLFVRRNGIAGILPHDFSAVKVADSPYWAILLSNPPEDQKNVFKRWVNTFKDKLGSSLVIDIIFDHTQFNDPGCFNITQVERGISLKKQYLDPKTYQIFLRNSLFKNVWFVQADDGSPIVQYALPAFVKQLAAENYRSLFVSCIIAGMIKRQESRGYALPLYSKPLVERITWMTTDLLIKKASSTVKSYADLRGIIQQLIVTRNFFINQGLWPFKVSSELELHTLITNLMKEGISQLDLIIAVPELLMISGMWAFQDYCCTEEKEKIWMNYGVWKYLS